MIDGIIKADGTSRLMRAELPATYEEFRAQCRDGTQPLDILFNALGWSQLPTFLNKANLLKDPTAALFCLGADAVPDDVFSYLGNYSKHWWEVYSDQSVWSAEIGDYTKVEFYKQSNKTTQVTYQYSDSVTVSNDGTVTLASPVKNFVANFESFNTNNSNGMITLRGKYVKISSGQIYHISSSSELTKYQSSPWLIGYVNSAALVTSYLTVAGETYYVSSVNRNAYPDSGTVNGLQYSYLGVPFDNAVTAPKIATGSYMGTGTYGSNNKNRLTFGFAPQMLILLRADLTEGYQNSTSIVIVTKDRPTVRINATYTVNNSSANRWFPNTFAFTGKEVTWYISESLASGATVDNGQFNQSGTTYYYIAIG